MNLNELKKLAEAATPGPWVEGISSHHTVSKHPKFFNYTIAEFRHARDAEWCDAANPQQVLKMIECMEVMATALESTETEMRYAGFSQYQSDNAMRKQVHEEAVKALAAFNELNSEV